MKNQILASFLVMLSGATNLLGIPGIVDGPRLSPVNNHTYYLLQSSTWSQAEMEATVLGGHLATIRNNAENDWVYDTFGSHVQSGTLGLWIGLNDIAVEGNFVWSSGEPVIYTNWDVGQPDNMDGSEDCAHIWLDPVRGLRKWNDYHDDPWHFRVQGVVEVVPEPATLLLFGLGGVLMRKRKEF